MRLRALVVASAGVVAAALGCRQLAGIEPVTLGDGGGDGGSCPTGTPLLTTPGDYNSLAVQAGFGYLDVTGSGVARFTTASAATAMTVLNAGIQYQSFGLGASSIYYSLFLGDDGGGVPAGAVHSIDLGGGNDNVVEKDAGAPTWIATSGSRVFWLRDFGIDVNDLTDTKLTLYCIGCSGPTSTAWMTITPMTTTTACTTPSCNAFGVVADANNVYVLILDTSGSTDTVLGCSVSAPCGSAYKQVATGVGGGGISTTGSELSYVTSDGTYLYAARPTSSHDIVRGNLTTTATSILTAQTVDALAVDQAAGNLYYAQQTGVDPQNNNIDSIFRIKSDGTGTPVMLACNVTNVVSMAVDAQNLYFLAGTTTFTPFYVAK